MKICAHTKIQINHKRVVGILNSNAFTYFQQIIFKNLEL